MWLFELADLFASLGDVSIRKFARGLMQGAAEGPGGAFDDPEGLPDPVVPEPPPPDLPDIGWDRFAPQERPF